VQSHETLTNNFAMANNSVKMVAALEVSCASFVFKSR